MAIDKELFYASHGLKYPVVARPYTDDMQVKEKIYTKDEVIAMFKDIQLDVEGQKFDTHIDKDIWNDVIRVCSDLIQQRINELKAECEDV